MRLEVNEPSSGLTPSQSDPVSPRHILWPIWISMVLIGSALYVRFRQFKTYGIAPQLIIISPQTLKEFANTPKIITSGLYISKFESFDVNSNNFEFTGIVWFSFVPGTISLETLKNFRFSQGQVTEVSEPDTKIVNGKLLVHYNIRVKFSTPLNFTDFPLDNHTIYIMLNNQSISPDEILLESLDRNLQVDARVEDFGWRLKDQEVKFGYQQAILDPHDSKKTINYPTVFFMLNYMRTSLRYIITILFPLLFLFYLTLFTLSLYPNQALSLATGGLTATLAYRFVIESLSPRVGYFMLSDKIFFLCLTADFFIFIYSMMNQFKAIGPTKTIRYGLFTGIYIVFHICVIYLILQ